MFKLTEVLAVFCLLAAHAESQECQTSQFRCDGICAEPCDGIPECSDGSDETTQLCSNSACRREDSLGGLFGDNPALQKFRCKYGGCIAGNFKCNGRSHCWDGSDELDDLCSTNTCKRRDVRCDYGACIRGLWECDGKADCRDGSDETLERCKNKACPSRRPFKCAYGACIEERKKCNKIADCADNSDETKELCGSDHTFSPRSSSIIDIPKAETNPQTPPPPTQPPPTRPPPTQPPPTQPPPQTPPPSPSDPCRASSLCSCPGSGICVPCDRLDSCSSLLDGPKCSLPSDDIDTGITVDVLACGSQAFVNVAVFSRNHEALCSSKEVPTETVVMADCWGTATILAQCRTDGKWHPYGNSLKDNTMEPSTELCQPRSINSLICGRRPRYRRPLIESVFSDPQLQWPWLADIYRNFTYSCTATVISKDYLLTAAHCVTKSEESTFAVNLPTLIVHYLGVDGNIKSSFVNAVHIHPDYKGGSLPSRDIALLKLEVPVQFSHKVVPACVSTEGFPDLKIAATFERNHAIWETLLQKYDSRCHSPLDRCVSREIEADQFCAIDVDGDKHLSKGASGGPYLVNMGNDAKEKWTVAGVVSSSSGKFTCKQPFTIFSRASDFWTWIGSCAHRQACL